MELNEERGESARSVSAGVTAPIEKGNEQIVCLPNQVLVQITEGRESEIDIVAN